MSNLAEMLRRTALSFPQKEALTWDQERLTWDELYRRALAVRENLLGQGVKRGDVVGIYAEHSPAQVAAIFGIAMCDAAFTILSPLLKENQLKHQISDADLRAIVGTPELLPSVEKVAAHRGMILAGVTPQGLLIGEESLPQADPEKPLARNLPTDVGYLIYTSGSSGRSKGVVVPLRTLLDGARIISGYLDITSQDVTLGMLPFSFDYGLNQLMTTVYQGARMVMHNYTFPKNLLDTLEAEGVTGMAAVPSLWPNILNPRFIDPATKPELKSLRYITTAGGMHTQELLKKLDEFFSHSQIIVMYGLTESFRSCWLPPSETFKRPGSIGKPVPEVEIMVWNQQGQPCAPGEKGELVHRGAFITYGYLNNPDLTQEKFIPLQTGGPGCLPEMVVRSGDIVHMDEDGYLYFHGRGDMQIKCAGYRVSPGEVEEASLAYSGISQVAAFGLPHPELGQEVCLAYSTYKGKPVDHSALAAHLSASLPYYAVPKSIRFCAHLPLTAHGKIDYPALIKQAPDWENSGAGD